ncbi:MAG: metallophosphoesterase, partial [Nitrososphaera sp.]|nr:metallophosphoesterase [Nitrososphaera sp.]
MRRPEPGLLREEAQKVFAEAGMTILKNYDQWIVQKGFGEVNPAKPNLLDAQWGQVELFLFNTVNDPGLMANKGRIGSKQFNALNQFLQNPTESSKGRNAVRIALLHHHPISAPQSLDKDLNRLYDWMQDGPLFLQYLNHLGFHFILHGHQHEPFRCTVDYEQGPGAGLHIVAAGSATQGNTAPHHNSFNLIDLLTPFEARFCRFDYSDTGYSEQPAMDVLLPVRPIEEVRVTKQEEPTVEDWAMRALIKGGFKHAYDVDSEHEYSLLEYKIEITKEQLYKAQYRRVGKVVEKRDSEGPVFIITGSPAMKLKHMNVAARDNLSGNG